MTLTREERREAIRQFVAKRADEPNMRRVIWSIVFELPDGEHILSCGPCTRPKAIRVLRQWLGRNPEAKADVEKIVALDPAERLDLKAQIEARNARRTPLHTLFKGVPMLAFDRPDRVPGSRLPPPRPLTVAGVWDKFSKW